ncbi:MAG: methyltransferase domain-containing protein [Solirubrobacterales bacterium]
MSDLFLEKLKARAGQVAEPAAPPQQQQSSPAAPAPAVNPRVLAFWQSDIANAHIRRLISGDESVSTASHFAELLDDFHRGSAAVSLRGGDPALEVELLRSDACRTIAIVDGAAERLEYGRARVPEELRQRVVFAQANLSTYEPDEPLGLVVAKSALHRCEDPDAIVSRLTGWLAPGGMVYLDEFVGPDRFQWSDAQIEIVNRLLACLPEELRRDLTSKDGEAKSAIGRPDEGRFRRDNPSEAVAGSRIRQALDSHLEPVEVRPYGGAVFHQLFARIMGNFAGRPEIVRLILELDAILTDRGVLESDYLWAAYRKPS